MIYMGYYIWKERSYYRVQRDNDPDESWTEDTIQDAKATINEVINEEG